MYLLAFIINSQFFLAWKTVALYERKLRTNRLYILCKVKGRHKNERVYIRVPINNIEISQNFGIQLSDHQQF